jgi:ribosomal protein S12 methylthiotransferase
MTALVQELAKLGVWIRLHYVYPYPHVDEVVPLMAAGKVLPYLDVPFQHAHPEVLRRMKRPACGERNIERIRAWRAICPELTIRSTFIAGFPGETESQFEYLLAFLREAELDRVGCFAYSPVEGAAANALDGALPDEVREQRRARFMQCRRRFRRDAWRARSAACSAPWSTRSAPGWRPGARRPMRRKSTAWFTSGPGDAGSRSATSST